MQLIAISTASADCSRESNAAIGGFFLFLILFDFSSKGKMQLLLKSSINITVNGNDVLGG